MPGCRARNDACKNSGQCDIWVTLFCAHSPPSSPPSWQTLFLVPSIGLIEKRRDFTRIRQCLKRDAHGGSGDRILKHDALDLEDILDDVWR